MLTLTLGGSGLRDFTVALDRYGDNISDVRPVFEGIATWFAQDQEQRFASSGRGQWQSLSPRYAEWKNNNYPGNPILTLTGVLRRSLTVRPLAVEDIGPRSMMVGTDVPYASAHQHGSGNLPARPMIVTLTSPQLRQIGSMLHEHAFAGVT